MLELNLKNILERYTKSFNTKEYPIESTETDLLMDVFSITQELKFENKQYWGRELGKCWEKLVKEIFKQNCKKYSEPKKFGKDEPADFFCGKYAIDTKYRVGSGDSGTLKKFKQNVKLLKEEKYTPIFLILREDNLPAAISNMKIGGGTIYLGKECFKFILEETSFDLQGWLEAIKKSKKYRIER